MSQVGKYTRFESREDLQERIHKLETELRNELFRSMLLIVSILMTISFIVILNEN